jgi:hypothetical protein
MSDSPVLTAAILAGQAAEAARSSPMVSAVQWVYRRLAVVATPDKAGHPEVSERWDTADTAMTASYAGVELTVRRSPSQPSLSYGSVISLADDLPEPSALDDLLASTPVGRDAAWHAGHAFELAAEALERYVMPPSVTAQMYRALGSIEGVAADPDAVDVAGRNGLGFLLTGVAGGNQEIIVDPRTHEFSGYQFLGDGLDLHAAAAWGLAILQRELVSGPGRRP